MDLTRRSAAALALSAALVPQAGRAAPPRKRPVVIAHRGASGERPEESLAAYKLAIEEGADFIEPDLVPTKDGVLVARHENEIGGTTDVAARPEFAARKTTKLIDGEKITGRVNEDFTLAELKTVRTRERLPQLRPESASHDGEGPILTYQEIVDLAKAESRRTGRVIGTYPEMKHPTYFASIGLPLEHRLADLLKKNDLSSATAPVFVQCFEVGALKTFRTLSKARLVQLVSNEGAPADFVARGDKTAYADMVTPAGLKAVAAYADGLGPDKVMVVPQDKERLLPATSLVRDAHAAGLVVHPWTVRAENFFLPESLRQGDKTAPDYLRQHGDVAALFAALYAAGVDGLFSDFTALAVKARAA